ncbi:Poly-beta-1,6-N-acetyl-D-glucosamine synthase [Rubripirellula lacrimiformis]|uniref:Poly-beta-1,6-N-acetyl-D-glucosamine synthase n=1 Tax=Rubripirellula lacrimiformis TaxID=1930273 RepID=A0A517NGL4_9BACT|nr:glycosyltransferase family 2 protein [Rubripirellula lacrimiformis]QDT06277.1 Poly-beta-1,6-N-acetyl-D-glucosamine synthase [Rubripirellula lacrimiformis]
MIQLLFWVALALLLHTYVIYPVLAMLVPRRGAALSCDARPPVSILVAAHNEDTVIGPKIENFFALDYPADKLELIIFDDGSVDATAETARRITDARVRVIGCEVRGGKAAAVNQMVTEAAYPTLLLTDANVSLRTDAVQQLVKHFRDEKVGAVTGAVRLIGSDQQFRSGESLYYRLERRIQRAESQLSSVMGVDGGMYALRRELFQPIPTDTILDDFLISMNVLRASRRIVYEPTATASETGTPSSRQEFHRRVRIAAGAVQLLRRGNVPRWNQCAIWFQFISHKLLRWISPLLITILLGCSILLARDSLMYSETLLSLGILIGGMLLALVVPRLRSTALDGIFFYFGLSQIAMAWGILRGVLNRQPPQWEKARRVEGDVSRKMTGTER